MSMSETREETGTSHMEQRAFENWLRREMPGRYLVGEPLSQFTWYRVGGPADFLVFPSDRKQIASVVAQCNQQRMPYVVIGQGANVLVHDRGFRGVVIRLGARFSSTEFSKDEVRVDAGKGLPSLLFECEQRGLGGLVGLSGVPGTVGGALIMNAGTSLGCIGDRVVRVDCLLNDSRICELSGDEIQFGYRSVPQLQGKIVLGATLRLYPAHKEDLARQRLGIIEERAGKQPLEHPSCGSVFKRPKGNYAGKLIEEAGLKGESYGDAIISSKHCGFILNRGGARAEDILVLIHRVQKRVFELSGVLLEPEVRFVGFSPDETRSLTS